MVRSGGQAGARQSTEIRVSHVPLTVRVWIVGRRILVTQHRSLCKHALRGTAIRATVALAAFGFLGVRTATAAPTASAMAPRVVVRLTEAVTDSLPIASRSGGRSVAANHPALGSELQAACRRSGVAGFRPFYPHAFGDPDLAKEHGLDSLFVAELADPSRVQDAVAGLRACSREVAGAWAESVGTPAQVIPNDAEFDRQYGMHNDGSLAGSVEDADIDAPEAWAIHTGDLGTVTIAFVDTGIDAHVEWIGRLVAGINTNDESNPDWTTDEIGHGTHVAGIAAATGHNAFGVAGVTWGASLMPIRITNNRGFARLLDAATGIIWAADGPDGDNGADIINLSIQFYNLTPEESDALESAVNYAHDRGALLIAAAGNADLDFGRPAGPVAAPARFANCMAVSGTDNSDQLGSFSNFGPEVEVSAPGDRIYSTDDQNDFAFRTGTSAASPFVAGLAALLKSFEPALTNIEIREILQATSEDLGEPGRDNSFGFGRINALAALRSLLIPAEILASMPPSGAIDARQPFDPDGANVDGWDSLELTFGDMPRSPVFAADFEVTHVLDDGSVSAGPAVASVLVVDPLTVRLELDGPIQPGGWTRVDHLVSGQSVCLGYLPGDANGDGTSNPALDITAWIDCLQQGGCDLWQGDINRSGSTDVVDLPRLIDLYNGAQTLQSWTGATIGVSPCR